MAVPAGYDPGQSLLAGGSGHLEAMRGGGWVGGAAMNAELFPVFEMNREVALRDIYRAGVPEGGYLNRIIQDINGSVALQGAIRRSPNTGYAPLPKDSIQHIIAALTAIVNLKAGDDIEPLIAAIRQVIDDGVLTIKPDDGKYTTTEGGGSATDVGKLVRLIGAVADTLEIKAMPAGGAGAGAGIPDVPAGEGEEEAAAMPAGGAGAGAGEEEEEEEAAAPPAGADVEDEEDMSAAAGAAWPEPPPAPAATGAAAEAELDTVTYFGRKVPKNVIERLKAFAPIPEEAGTEKEKQAQFFSAIRNLLIDVQGRKDASRGVIIIEIPEVLPASSTGGAGAGAGAGSVPAARTGGARRSRKTRRSRNKPLRKARTHRHH